MSLACIADLSKTKPTAAGKVKYRFTVLMDALGETVGSIGWIYLPEAKEGFRVWPPKRGHVKTVTGVGRKLTQHLEALVEQKLNREFDKDEIDVIEYEQAVLRGDL